MSSLRLAIKKSMLDAGLSAPAPSRKPKKSATTSTAARRPGDPPRKRGRPRKHPLPEEDHNHDDEDVNEEEGLEFSSSQEEEEEEEEEGEVEEEHGFGDEERENDDEEEEEESLSKPTAVESKSKDDDEGKDDSSSRLEGDGSDNDSQQSRKRKKKALKCQNNAATKIQKMLKAKKKSTDGVASVSADSEEASSVPVDDSEERSKETSEKTKRPRSPKLPNATAPKKSFDGGDGNEPTAHRNETKQQHPSTKRSKKPGHVPGPPEEVIEWMANMPPEEARQKITTGLRLKVRFVTKVKKPSGKVIRRLKWFGGLVTGVSTGGSRVRIKYDDGTSEVTKFPDKDIIVDDTDNGRHKVPPDAFQPPPGVGDDPDEEKAHGGGLEKDETEDKAPKEENQEETEATPPAKKRDTETAQQDDTVAVKEDDVRPSEQQQQRNAEKLERRKKKKKKKRLLEKAAKADVTAAGAGDVDESRRSPLPFSEGKSPVESPDRREAEQLPQQDDKQTDSEPPGEEVQRSKTSPGGAAMDEEEEVVVAEIVEEPSPVPDKGDSENRGSKLAPATETKKSAAALAPTKTKPSPPVKGDDNDEGAKDSTKKKPVATAAKTESTTAENIEEGRKKKKDQRQEPKVEDAKPEASPDVAADNRGRSTPVQEEPKEAGLQTPVTQKRTVLEETVLEDTPVTERRIEPTTALLGEEQERPKKGKKRKKKRLLEQGRSSSDETNAKRSKTTHDASVARKVSEESKGSKEADNPDQPTSADAEFVAPPKKMKKKKRDRMISLENARATNDDEGGENEEIKVATASAKKRKREDGGPRRSPKPSPVDQTTVPQTPDPRRTDSKGIAKLDSQNDSSGEIVRPLSTSANSAFEKKRHKKQKRMKETAGLTTDQNGTPTQHDVADGDGVSAPRSGRRAAQQANERISSKQELVIKDTFSKPKKKRGEQVKDKGGKLVKDGEKSDEEEAPAWVQCDHCSKWRVLPSDVDPDTLPKKWYCELNVDSQHNTCDAPEQTAQEVAKARRKEKRRQARRKAQAEAAAAAAANEGSQDEAEQSSEGSRRQRPEATKEGRREKKEGKNKRSRTPVLTTPSEESGGSQGEDEGGKKSSKKTKASESDENVAAEPGKGAKGSKPKKRSKEGKEEKTKGKGKGRNGASKDDEDDTDNQDWVQCDKCHKWRRLPSHISADDLPDTWYCTMKEWDPENANCDAEEDKADPTHREYNPMGAGSGGSKLSYRSLIFGTGRKHNRPVSERQRAAESIFARVPLDGSVDYPVVMYADSSVFASKAKDKAEERLGDHTPFLDMMARSNLWAELRGLNYLMQAAATAPAPPPIVPLAAPVPVVAPITYSSLPMGLKAEMKELVLFALGDKTLTIDELLLEAQGRRWEGVPQRWHELRCLCTLQSVGEDLQALIREGRVLERRNSAGISAFCKAPTSIPSPTSEVAVRNSKCIKIAKPWKRGNFEVTSN